ncbi:MAG: PIG-L family deacetylase [Planctomycetes bacterium]|nr:PIG-L family deacetylase [Planctomycetota bacterium]
MITHDFPPLLPVETFFHGKVLVVTPHPDDEVIGCGGTIAMLRERSIDVVVVHVTDGALGDPGSHFEDIVTIRRRESAEALAELGVSRTRELGFPDASLPERLAELRDVLRQTIEEEAPTFVMYPSPFEAHADHLALAAIVAEIFEPGDLGVQAVYFYGVNSPVPASCLVDVTPAYEKKQAAVRRYASQITYIDIPGKVRALDSARTVNIEDRNVEVCEAFCRVAPGELTRFLAAVGELKESSRCA